MKYFSVPADFKYETVDKYHDLNQRYEDSQVIEAYGQVTAGAILNSGRVTDVLPKIDFKDFENYIHYLKDRNIEFNYTLNPACMGNLEFSEEGLREIDKLLLRLSGIGIEYLTIALPPLMEFVRASSYNFKIKASSICEIITPGQALFYKKMGAERIVVDPDVTRKFRTLRNIGRVFGDGIEIIVNNVCYKHCAYKLFHYNHEAHCVSGNSDQTIRDYYFNRCSLQKSNAVENSLKLNWIRPEDLKYYLEAGICLFKIQGRQNVLSGDLIRAIECYINEDFEGSLFDLITIFAPYNSFQPYIDNKKLAGFINRFIENEDFCQNVCSECNYCASYAKKCLDIEKTEELNKKASVFYWEYDRFTQLLEEIKNQKVIPKLFDEDDLKEEYKF